jgi:methionine sulfoxide reductase heme-binding subunit
VDAERGGAAAGDGAAVRERAVGARGARGAPPNSHVGIDPPHARHRSTAPRRDRARRIARLAHPLIILIALVPAARLVAGIFLGGLGANPIEEIQHRTGDWALNFLVATLAVTPIRRLFGWGWLVPYRRTLGLAAFFYATIHLLNYLVLDLFFDWGEIGEDIVKRPYITIGMAAFIALLPLAVTSTKGWIRRLGGRRWNRLHRLIYPAAIAGSIHYWMSVKKDIAKPLTYVLLFSLLFAVRIAFWYADRRRRASGGVA